MSIAENVARVQEKIVESALSSGRNPEHITLVAATKNQGKEAISQAISGGIRVCGENRVQEMVEHIKNESYIGARLDFIGHLQTNKVKQVVGQVSLIQSVGSYRLMEEIGKQAVKLDRVQDILLEINVEEETSKTGFLLKDLPEMVDKIPLVSGINVRGIMAIPPKMESEMKQRKIFERLYNLYIDFSEKMGDNYTEVDCLSMGMSDDYPFAVMHGSTMVRVGTALFGAR